jgi:hypothetical protein
MSIEQAPRIDQGPSVVITGTARVMSYRRAHESILPQPERGVITTDAPARAVVRIVDTWVRSWFIVASERRGVRPYHWPAIPPPRH